MGATIAMTCYDENDFQRLDGSDMQGIGNAIERPLTYILIILVLGLAVSRSSLPSGDARENNVAVGAASEGRVASAGEDRVAVISEDRFAPAAEERVAVAGESRVAANVLELEIVAGEARYAFKIEMAITPAERSRGLMNRHELALDAGMLFDYGRPRYVSFWMKDTLIPLDMIFIKDDGRIARIAKRTVPLSLAAVPSGEPVLAVLEVIGGTADRLGIAPGDTVIHPIFGNAD